MEKSRWHRFSELLMAAGFLTVMPGIFLTRSPAIPAIGGFLLFLIGVELYLKTRDLPYGE